MAGNPSDKMQVVGMGDLTHPGTCMSCGSGNYTEGYVRLGVYYEYEGEMYLCGNCIQELAETYNMLTVAESEHLRKSAENALTELAAASEELRTARERLAIYDAAVSSAFNSNVNGADNPGSVIVKGPTESDSGSVRLVKQATGGASSGEPEPKKSVTLKQRGGASRNESANPSAGKGGINL